MPGDDQHQPVPPDRRPVRDPATRARDHDQIDRLTDDLLPDLIDRLTASGLGEIEIREDDWRIRLRLPASGGTSDGSRDGRGADSRHDRADRTTDRQHAQPPARQAGTGPTSGSAPLAAGAGPATSGAPDGRSNGSNPSMAGAVGSVGSPGSSAPVGPHRVIAISPAVGVFQPRPDLRPGARVRQGDRIGAVDLLGVPQDVVAPDDGIVVDTLAQSGEGVEYGQDLVVIEPGRGRHGGDDAADRGDHPDQPVSEG